MLDILMFFLRDLITWQHNKLLFVNELVKEEDQSTGIVQECSVELQTCALLTIKKLNLFIVDQVFVVFGSFLFWFVQ